MKAMILCGGQGTRLREHTELMPKPMVEIGGRPIIWHIMKLYAHYGITEFILCLGYKAHTIKEYFLNYEARNSDFTIELGRSETVHYHGPSHGEQGWKVTLAFTGENAMTGARVMRAAKYLDESDSAFHLTYGDGVSDVNLAELSRFHGSHGKLATVTGVYPATRFGEIKSESGSVTTFSEKAPISKGVVSGGFFVLDRGFLRYLTDEDSCMMEYDPLQRCVSDGQLCVYEHSGYFQCMDTHRDWMRLEAEWESGNPPWKVWK